MSAPRVGDRVHVEFDGEVIKSVPHFVMVRHEIDGGDQVYVRTAVVTVIVPPIKVGDYVYPTNVGQLMEGSVIAADGLAAWTKRTRAWHYGNQIMHDHEVGVRGDQRVLRIGRGTS